MTTKVEETVIKHGEDIATLKERQNSLDKMVEKVILQLEDSTKRIESAVQDYKTHTNGNVKDLYKKYNEQQKEIARRLSPGTVVVISGLCTIIGGLVGALAVTLRGGF